MKFLKSNEPQFKDFIGMFPTGFPAKTCQKIIEAYEDLDKMGKSVQGRVGGVGKPAEVNKSAKNSRDIELGVYHYYKDLLYECNTHLQECYNLYMAEYWQINQYLSKHDVTAWQIQKYDAKDGGGYHNFHIENSGVANMRRVMAYIIYLNDIDDGGETEFLHQAIRVKPETGKVIIFPAYFTHVHRGNPVLSGQDKYIMTGWLEYV
jgi:hypothetical protein